MTLLMDFTLFWAKALLQTETTQATAQMTERDELGKTFTSFLHKLYVRHFSTTTLKALSTSSPWIGRLLPDMSEFVLTVLACPPSWCDHEVSDQISEVCRNLMETHTIPELSVKQEARIPDQQVAWMLLRAMIIDPSAQTHLEGHLDLFLRYNQLDDLESWAKSRLNVIQTIKFLSGLKAQFAEQLLSHVDACLDNKLTEQTGSLQGPLEEASLSCLEVMCCEELNLSTQDRLVTLIAKHVIEKVVADVGQPRAGELALGLRWVAIRRMRVFSTFLSGPYSEKLPECFKMNAHLILNGLLSGLKSQTLNQVSHHCILALISHREAESILDSANLVSTVQELCNSGLVSVAGNQLLCLVSKMGSPEDCQLVLKRVIETTFVDFRPDPEDEEELRDARTKTDSLLDLMVEVGIVGDEILDIIYKIARICLVTDGLLDQGGYLLTQVSESLTCSSLERGSLLVQVF